MNISNQHTNSQEITRGRRRRQQTDVEEKQPFDLIFFNQLITWEESFYCHQVTQEVLERMIAAYGKLVEYFDSKKDPIKKYFLDKLQFTLGRPYVVRMMLKQKQDSDATSPEQVKKPPHHRKIKTQVSFELDKYVQEFDHLNGHILKNHILSDLPENTDQIRQKQRASNFQLQVELEDHIEQKHEIQVLVEKFQTEQVMIDEFNKLQLDVQTHKIEEKIAARRNSVDGKSPPQMSTESAGKKKTLHRQTHSQFYQYKLDDPNVIEHPTKSQQALEV